MIYAVRLALSFNTWISKKLFLSLTLRIYQNDHFFAENMSLFRGTCGIMVIIITSELAYLVSNPE